MLKLPPPIWALVYVLIAAAISWSLGWPKFLGLPLAPLGIALVAVAWIPPVWAIVLFRREGTEVSPTSPANRTLVTSGPYRYPQPHVSGPRYRHPGHRRLGRRLANVHCAHRRLRHRQLDSHPLRRRQDAPSVRRDV